METSPSMTVPIRGGNGLDIDGWDATKPFRIKGRTQWWASQELIEKVITQQQQIEKAHATLRQVIAEIRIQQREYFKKWSDITWMVRRRTRTLEARQAELKTLVRDALEAGDLARLILDHDGSIDTLRERLFSPAFIEQQAKRLNTEQRRREAISRKFKQLGIEHPFHRTKNGHADQAGQ